MSYRPEVDGLRAVAVLAVILFHAGFAFAQGGYLGVDLFFVVSGYLIASILLAGHADGNFSLTAFYLRRIRRILPALLLTMALTSIPAVIWMQPDHLENFGQSLVATALMANNVLLWLTGGYWQLDAEFKPLMHSWSLGAEEQFYLLGVPLILLALRRWDVRGMGLLLIAVFVTSLILATVLAARDSEAAYLLLPARGWELAIGSLVALARPRVQLDGRLADMLALIGLAASCLPLALFDKNIAAPGLPTLIPTGGCALFLLAACKERGAGWLLARPLAVQIGLASYSAYLFHQPVFAFVRLLSFGPPGPEKLALYIPAILGAAWLSLHWVERPARNPSRLGDRALLLACGGGTWLAIAAGLLLHFSHGLAWRWPEMGGSRLSNMAYVDRAFRFQDARLDPKRRSDNVLVIGHSFARDFINMGLETGHLRPGELRYQLAIFCDDLSPADLTDPAADTAVFALTTSAESAACLVEKARALRRAGVPHVVILGYKNFGWSNSAVMRLPTNQRYIARVPPLAGDLSGNTAARARIPADMFVDLFALLGADSDGTVPVFTPEGRFISQDTHHLTPAGARWLGEIVFAQPQFADLARRGIAMPLCEPGRQTACREPGRKR
ncbi:MAG: acyltransferase [Novosphingobium sp.]